MTSRIKCAIYTRKSSEEGLDQSFNSLDAQREACEAYVLSQRHEGWVALSAKYDDGGFSGGNMERPALKKLMADIADGKVNTVVVYKVDRLTRSLADFAKLVEQFDSKGVTFVSVTQQFNTTTSMGRLTLNVLLSFAQFEREVTGERIRDKIAASKAKGMWMGGRVPPGYDLRERRLYINPVEAEQVREIFRQYLRLRTVPALMNHLISIGIRTKVRISPGGMKTGGLSYSRGGLYRLLNNRIYIGEIEHKQSIYAGEHEGIVDLETWKQVQELLVQNRQGRSDRPRTQGGGMLTGLLFSEDGIRYIPTNAQKRGLRYHYYTSQAIIKGNKDIPMGRLPAPALESAVASRINEFLQSSSEVLDGLKQFDSEDLNYGMLLREAKQRASEWARLTYPERADLVRSMLHRVLVTEGWLEIQLDLEAVIQVLLHRPAQEEIGKKNVHSFSLKAAFRHFAQGKSLKLVIGNERLASSASREAIVKAIARARAWYDLIAEGKAAGLSDLARQQGLTHRYVKNIFPLAFLSPESVEFLLNNPDDQPLTLDSLMGKVPVLLDQQRSFVRFD